MAQDNPLIPCKICQTLTLSQRVDRVVHNAKYETEYDSCNSALELLKKVNVHTSSEADLSLFPVWKEKLFNCAASMHKTLFR